MLNWTEIGVDSTCLSPKRLPEDYQTGRKWLINAFQQSTSDLVISVAARQSEVDQQMTRLGLVIIDLQEHAQALQDAQFSHETTQARLHSTMEAGFNASLAQLFMIERSATVLQEVLQETSQSIAQMTSISWFVGAVWKWGTLAIIISLVVCAVLSGNTSFARYVTATISRFSDPHRFTPLINLK